MNGLPAWKASVRFPAPASFIYVTFDWATEIFRRGRWSGRLSAWEEGLPMGIIPRMGPVSSIMGEIMQIAIPVDQANHPMAVRRYADWVLRPRLMAIAGVRR